MHQSAPHVSGLIAYLISVQGNTTPALMSQRLKDLALKGILNPYSLRKLQHLSRRFPLL